MLELMKKAALSAGEVIEDYYHKSYEVRFKEDNSLVTEADKAAEKTILEILKKETNYNIYAEESGFQFGDSDFLWVIDPLDGTTNFSRKIPFFCTSIGLFKGEDPYAGVIFNPLTKELFIAEKGKGAYLNDVLLESCKPHRTIGIICERGKKLPADKQYVDSIKKTSRSYESIRTFGSTALELAYIAAGRMDGFTTYGDHLYDTAAGISIAKEAGCKVSNWKGEDWKIHDEDLLVSSSFIHEELVDLLKDS